MNARSVVVFSCLFFLLPGVAVRATAQDPAVELRARITGYVQKVHCKQGAAVKKGDLLFRSMRRPTRLNLPRPRRRLPWSRHN
jgi:multidrug resistance efflux pump